MVVVYDQQSVVCARHEAACLRKFGLEGLASAAFESQRTRCYSSHIIVQFRVALQVILV